MIHKIAPEITTARLRLRPHRLEDATSLAALWSDPVVVRHFGGQPALPEDSWNRLLRYVGHWLLNGYGLWAIEEAATGRLVGEAGLFDGRRGLGDRFDGQPEAGWVLAPKAHGRGYAQEAMQAALRWGEHEHGWSRTVCMIDPENIGSFRTAAALDYQRFGQRRYRGREIVLLERARR